MSESVLTPRPDQVAELTRGLDLPLPSIAAPIMIVLAETLAAAFAHVRDEWPDTVETGSEPEVTALLVSRLNAMVDEADDDTGLWRSLVRCVGRSDECISFDGSHLEKQPDLSIWLTCRSARFPLVAEAKLLGKHQDRGDVLFAGRAPLSHWRIWLGRPRGIHARLCSGRFDDIHETFGLFWTRGPRRDLQRRDGTSRARQHNRCRVLAAWARL
ncbi:hypothetical protein [Novosphingobium sp. YAF33]|uniref:hypothetical protein n=1 Tax=Novosphingobium sp. YAF33 TaxID=3233082 RepID=UPI003F94B218